MRDWSKEFNALPDDVREIACAIDTRHRINHLIMEKDRLNRRHRQSLKEINDHIKNLEKWMKDNF